MYKVTRFYTRTGRRRNECLKKEQRQLAFHVVGFLSFASRDAPVQLWLSSRSSGANSATTCLVPFCMLGWDLTYFFFFSTATGLRCICLAIGLPHSTNTSTVVVHGLYSCIAAPGRDHQPHRTFLGANPIFSFLLSTPPLALLPGY